jgi:hypothetical protein
MCLEDCDSHFLLNTRFLLAGRRDWVCETSSELQSDSAPFVDEHKVRTECSCSDAIECINHKVRFVLR